MKDQNENPETEQVTTITVPIRQSDLDGAQNAAKFYGLATVEEYVYQLIMANLAQGEPETDADELYNYLNHSAAHEPPPPTLPEAESAE